MYFIEILFFIIYIRFLISWPKQTVVWTLIAFWEIIALGFIIWGLVWASEVSSSSNNLWVLTPTAIGIVMTYVFYKLLRNIFGNNTNYGSADSKEETLPNNKDAFVNSIFKSKSEDNPEP